MLEVILTLHVIIVAALVGIVLLQRSEGGALGIGGGGGGLMSGRSAANSLTRGTALLAALFFSTSMGLAIFADRGPSRAEQIEALTGEKLEDAPNLAPGEIDAEDLLGSFGVGIPTTDQAEAPDAIASPSDTDLPAGPVSETAIESEPQDSEEETGAVNSDESAASPPAKTTP